MELRHGMIRRRKFLELEVPSTVGFTGSDGVSLSVGLSSRVLRDMGDW